MMNVQIPAGESFDTSIMIRGAAGDRNGNANGDARGLMPIIQPRVRDRWLGLARRNYTPEAVKSTLEGTNYGNRLYFLLSMFELLEETWPRVSKNLHEVKTTVSRLEWIVQPWARKNAKPTARAQAKADFVEDAIYRMRANPLTGNSGFVEMIYHLMDAYGKGVSVSEIDWERGTGEHAGAWVPKGTRFIRPCYYDYPPEPEQIERLMLSPSGNPHQQADLVDFPPNKFLVGGYAWRSSAILGRVAMLRTLAPWWIYQSFATEWLMQFGQIFGMPLRVAKYARPSDLPVVSQMLEQMGAVSWAALPFGTEIELSESSKGAQDNPNAYLLSYCDTLADLMILGQTLTSNVSSQGGSRALGDVHERTLSGRTKHAAGWAGEMMTNQISRPLINLNWNEDSEVPVILPRIEDPKDPQALAERDKILFVDMGLPVALEFLYTQHSVPQPEEGADLFKVPEPVLPAGPGPTGQKGARGAATKPTRTNSGRPAKSGQRSLAALDGLEVPEDVISALERLPEALREHYVDELLASGRGLGHYKGGQPGGGRWISAQVLKAQERVRDVLAKWPPEGQHRARRNILAFGLPDNYAEFAAYNAPGLADRVDDLARKVKVPTRIKIGDLKTTQSSIDSEKVLGMLSTAEASEEPVGHRPIVIKRSNKLWLWDGHHRAVKHRMLDQEEMDVRLVDANEDPEATP